MGFLLAWRVCVCECVCPVRAACPQFGACWPNKTDTGRYEIRTGLRAKGLRTGLRAKGLRSRKGTLIGDRTQGHEIKGLALCQLSYEGTDSTGFEQAATRSRCGAEATVHN